MHRGSILTNRMTDLADESKKDLEWAKISEGPWTKRRKHQLVVCNLELEPTILLLGGFDGETAFDLNDVWSLKELGDVDCTGDSKVSRLLFIYKKSTIL